MYDPRKPFNEQIRELIKSTHPAEGPIVVRPFGKRFQVERDASYWSNFYELTSSDGIGTKGMLHWKMNTLQNGVQDAFAMVVDDLIEGGYIPALLQDHIMLQEEDKDRALLATRTLVDLCMKNKWVSGKDSFPIAITGGETATLNTLQGFEMGITATGYVRKGCEVTQNAMEGDAVIGLGSSGVHSNGMSFLLDEFFTKRGMKLSDMLPWGVSVGEELTKPTNVYLPAVKELISYFEDQNIKANSAIHGMVHITGGGLSKLRELLPKGSELGIEVSNKHLLEPQQIFRYVHEELGVPSEKMYTRFNNGIGYVIALDSSYVTEVLALLRKYFPADVVGSVTSGCQSISILSHYDDVEVRY